MRMTKAAKRWLSVFSKMYEPDVSLVGIKRATKIAKGRRAPSLGKLHLDRALSELIDDTEDPADG